MSAEPAAGPAPAVPPAPPDPPARPQLGRGLEVRGITVAHGRMPAVRGVSLSVAHGELVALLGRNGAGKTTTLRAVAGLGRVAAGEVLVDGVTVSRRPAWQVARRGVAMVLEGARCFGGQTVAENLALGRLLAPDRAAADARVRWALETFGALGERRDQPAAMLSGGERQQLAISQALVAGARVLLLDEPSVGLAPVIVTRVFDLLAELRAGLQPPAILVAEQLVAPVLRVADRAVVLDGGRVVVEGGAAELRGSPELVEAYLGRAPQRPPAGAAPGGGRRGGAGRS